MIPRPPFFRPRAADPGEDWARATLGPLRREVAECDVARAVMARLAAIGPHRTMGAGRRRAWLAAGIAAAGLLAALAVPVMIFGDERLVREAWTLLAFCGRMTVAAGSLLASFAGRALLVAGALLKPVWILIQVFAPLLRGAGVLAAAFGALSILFSLFAFAHALRTAPARTLKGGSR